MSSWLKIVGTQTGRFVLGLTGASLKNNSGTVQVRSNDDADFAPLESESIGLNNNTTGYAVDITTSASQTASYSLTLPVDDGTAGQVLGTDGAGVLSWVSAGDTSQDWKADTTSFAFGSASTITAFTLPADAVVDRVSVIVDSAFDGTPTMSVGVDGGSASQYVASSDVLLSATDRFDVPYQGEANTSSEDLEIYYSAGGATTGSGRVIVTYSIPV